jgi:hypothetical protein
MKTFLMYLILIVAFYLYTNVMIKIGLSRMDESENKVNNSTEIINSEENS